MTITPWEDPVFEPIRDALVKRMVELGSTDASAERADEMMRGWDRFTDNDVDEHGHIVCLSWMDPEVVRLLFKALYLHYGALHRLSEQTV